MSLESTGGVGGVVPFSHCSIFYFSLDDELHGPG